MESQHIFKSCFYFVIYQNGQFESFVVQCNKSLNDRSLEEQWILFPSNLDISLYFVLGNKIPCSPQGQSLSVTCLFQFLTEIWAHCDSCIPREWFPMAIVQNMCISNLSIIIIWMLEGYLVTKVRPQYVYFLMQYSIIWQIKIYNYCIAWGCCSFRSCEQ